MILRVLRFFVLSCPLVGAASVPRYEVAWQFAAELQRDYAKDRAQALLGHTDSERMFRRMVQPLGDEASEDPRAKDAWQNAYWPIVVKDIGSLAAYETLFAEQVALLEGERVLLCALQQANGVFTTILLWLDERPDGRIVIVDFKAMSQRLASTQRMRAFIVIFGGIFTLRLDEEEQLLSRENAHAHHLQRYLTHAARGGFDDALGELKQMPFNVQSTRLWQDARDGLALLGHQTSLQDAIRQTASRASLNPVLALTDAQRRKDLAAEIAALDRLADMSFQSPFVRATKAGALLAAGKHIESLSLAREIYQLNPHSEMACSVAVHSAARLKDTPAALAALRVWSRLAAPQAIDESLAKSESMREFRSSDAYRAWLVERVEVKVSAP